ncbi:helix-turn-helix transcriptional regulator [Erythrobacter ani]|uniref:Response regulator transcription factor n=1 Tax=Erythrobacter ani TaxID=2827235 RepID=A0ABS6SML9_9SPHN|nr:LuxR C-terminal-related transcriptional regulator [Erythrobacter ani]MBV7266290.1 response regulator transcription factor [Erythrobacter ani]
MVDSTSAAIVCHSTFLLDMVAENLRERGITVVAAESRFADISDECRPDVMVVVEAAPGEVFRSADKIDALARRFSRWLTIGSSEQGSAFQRLRAIRSDISGVPLDIGSEDMYHAVELAAHASSVCIGGTCCKCISREMHKLNAAHLDRGQWEILEMLADGATNKHIANRFECEESKVKGMIRRLLTAIDASNRTQAAVLAARAGL